METVAVAPTLLRLAGNEGRNCQKQFQSPGLLETSVHGDSAAYSESFYSFSSFGWSPLHALETSRYHYIEAPTPELYDVIADPQEKNNLAPQQTATVAVLEDKLQALLRQNPFKPQENTAPQALSPDALEKLRALGYVAYRSPVSPRRWRQAARSQEQVVGIQCHPGRPAMPFSAGDFRPGRACWRQVAKRKIRRCTLSLSCWARSCARQQKWEEARPLAENAWN